MPCVYTLERTHIVCYRVKYLIYNAYSIIISAVNVCYYFKKHCPLTNMLLLIMTLLLLTTIIFLKNSSHPRTKFLLKIIYLLIMKLLLLTTIIFFKFLSSPNQIWKLYICWCVLSTPLSGWNECHRLSQNGVQTHNWPACLAVNHPFLAGSVSLLC